MTYEMPEPCGLHEPHGSHAHGEDWCPGYASPSAETRYEHVPLSVDDWWQQVHGGSL